MKDESDSESLRLCFTSLCDWSSKLPPLSQPIRGKTKIIHALVVSVFPHFTLFTLSLAPFFFFFAFFWLAVLVSSVNGLRYSIERALFNQLSINDFWFNDNPQETRNLSFIDLPVFFSLNFSMKLRWKHSKQTWRRWNRKRGSWKKPLILWTKK